MARAMGGISQWCDILEDGLQCPVCFEVPQCPIFQCSTGHHICVLCKNKLSVCPTCKASFLETRNFFAEYVANKLGDLQLSIENEIQNIKSNGKEESRSTCTQTDEMAFKVLKSKSSSATQTGEMARTNIENLRAKGIGTRLRPYSCQIGSCMFQASYKGLVHHLAEYHRDTFYEVYEFRGQFTESCIIRAHAFRQSYDFAFLKNGKDLFFFKITVTSNGLSAHVLLAKNVEIANLFHYDLAIGKGSYKLMRHGKVIPCGGSAATVCENSEWICNEQLHRNTTATLVDVTITIRRCVCEQFRENVGAVNP